MAMKGSGMRWALLTLAACIGGEEGAGGEALVGACEFL